jgi:hypothetical protein
LRIAQLARRALPATIAKPIAKTTTISGLIGATQQFHQRLAS